MCAFLGDGEAGRSGWIIPTPDPGLPIANTRAYEGLYVHPVYGEVYIRDAREMDNREGDNKAGDSKAENRDKLMLSYGRMEFSMYLTELTQNKAVFKTEVQVIDWLIPPVWIPMALDSRGRARSMRLPFLRESGPALFLRQELGGKVCDSGSRMVSTGSLVTFVSLVIMCIFT